MQQMSSGSLCLCLCLCLSPHPIRLPLPPNFFSRPTRVSARTGDSPTSTNDSRSLNLSVLRFTLGIPGLDESYLPRWIGYGFGSLLLLNHFVGSDTSSLTPAQLRTEALGLSVAAFSVVLPYLGKFLPGATMVSEVSLPEGNKQLFVMSGSMPDTLKEDFAWATYTLLRNTSSIAVLISAGEALCIRGYWRTPADVLKDGLPSWFEKQILKTGLHDSAETLYFPQSTDFGWDFLPKGTRSLLVQPLFQDSDYDMQMAGKNKGFLILASSIEYAYNDKDRSWIQAVANKFRASIIWVCQSSCKGEQLQGKREPAED